MAWNPRPLLRTIQQTTKRSAPAPSSCPTALSPSARRQLLGVFRRLAAVLHMTAQSAESAGKLERHAALGARLAIFRARVEAGATSPLLATELADFGQDFKNFITVELGFRPA